MLLEKSEEMLPVSGINSPLPHQKTPPSRLPPTIFYFPHKKFILPTLNNNFHVIENL